MTPNNGIGVKRLAEVLLIREASHGRTYLVAMKFIHHTLHGPHNCYFDETEKDDIFGVAGWVGTFENWMALEDRWRKALPAEAKGDFHYTDFWNDPKHYAAKWTQEKRLEHITTLATIAHDCTAFGVGFVFSKTSYDELIPPKNKKALISPLHFCLAQCIVGILDFYKTIPSPPPPPLRFMFDRKEGQKESLGDVYYNVRKLFDKDHILGNISIGDRKHECPLQAADLLIGELRRRRIGHESKIMDILCRKRPLIVAFPTDQEFRAHLKNVLVELKNKSKA